MKHLVRLVVVVAICAIATYPANADLVLTTPTGLNAGDHFRFMFLTSALNKTQATSSSISSYDSFVRSDVSNKYGTVTYNGSAITDWLAVGSTSTTSAFDHLGGSQANVSIWLPGGTQVAASLTTSTNGLWSGALEHAVDQYLDASSASAISSSYVWTGSNADGTIGTYYLGGSPFVRAGVPDLNTYFGWMSSTNDFPNSQKPMYGVSPDLTVPTPSSVPEIDPATGGSALSLVAGVLAMIEQRRRRGWAIAMTA